jgi:hypothetical protein
MGICICCCCNKKETESIENTLLVFNAIEIFFLLFGLILIEWRIASTLCLVLNILIILFLASMLAIVIIFKIFRDNKSIYSKCRKVCYILAYVGMGLSIACVVLSILSESLISQKVNEYEHPCMYKFNEKSDTRRALVFHNETEIKKICEDVDKNNIGEVFAYHWSATKEIVISYICASIIEIFSLIGAFYWYNDVRRIKYCIQRKMNEEKGLIKYGQLGGYKGTNVKVDKIYANNIEQNGNEEILGIRDNRNVNMITNRNRDNIVSSRNSFNELNITNNNNRNDNLQNEDIVNQGENGEIIINNIEQKEETKRKDSISEEDFY